MELKSSLGRAGSGALPIPVHPVPEGPARLGCAADSTTGLRGPLRSGEAGGADRLPAAGGKGLRQRSVARAGCLAAARARRQALVLVREVQAALARYPSDFERADAAFDTWADVIPGPPPTGQTGAAATVEIDDLLLEALFDELAGSSEDLQERVLCILESGWARLRGTGKGAARLSEATAAAVMDGMARLCLASAELTSDGPTLKLPGLAWVRGDASRFVALERLLRLAKACPELRSHVGAVAMAFAQAAPQLHPDCVKRLFRVLGTVALGHEHQATGGLAQVAAILRPLLGASEAEVPLAALHAGACGLVEASVYSPDAARQFGGTGVAGVAGQLATPQALLDWGIERLVHAVAHGAQGVPAQRIGAVAHALAGALDLDSMPSFCRGGELALGQAVTHALLCVPMIDTQQLTAWVAGLYVHMNLVRRDSKELADVRRPMDQAFQQVHAIVGADPAKVSGALARGFALAREPALALGWRDLSPQARWGLLETVLVVPALAGADPSPGRQLHSIAELALPPHLAWMRTELALRIAQGCGLDIDAPAWSVVHQALLERLDTEEGTVEAEAGTAAGAAKPEPSVLPRWRVDDMMAFYEELEAQFDVTRLHRKRPGDIAPQVRAQNEPQWREALQLFTLLRRDALRRYGDTRNPLFASLDRRLGTTQTLLRAALARPGQSRAGASVRSNASRSSNTKQLPL